MWEVFKNWFVSIDFNESFFCISFLILAHKICSHFHSYYSISVSVGKVYKTKGKIFSAIYIHVAINNIACVADCWNAFLTKQEIVHERNFSAIRRRSRSIFRYHVDIFHVEIVASTGSNGANSAELRTYSKASPFYFSTQVIRKHGPSAKYRFLFVNINFLWCASFYVTSNILDLLLVFTMPLIHRWLLNTDDGASKTFANSWDYSENSYSANKNFGKCWQLYLSGGCNRWRKSHHPMLKAPNFFNFRYMSVIFWHFNKRDSRNLLSIKMNKYTLRDRGKIVSIFLRNNSSVVLAQR